jgi:hypothetical protein
MKSEELEEAIFQAIGEVTALFMSNPQPGTEQVMPCARIGRDLAIKISEMNRARIAELEKALSASKGEVSFKDTRIEELEADRLKNKRAIEEARGWLRLLRKQFDNDSLQHSPIAFRATNTGVLTLLDDAMGEEKYCTYCKMVGLHDYSECDAATDEEGG